MCDPANYVSVVCIRVSASARNGVARIGNRGLVHVSGNYLVFGADFDASPSILGGGRVPRDG